MAKNESFSLFQAKAAWMGGLSADERFVVLFTCFITRASAYDVAVTFPFIQWELKHGPDVSCCVDLV